MLSPFNLAYHFKYGLEKLKSSSDPYFSYAEVSTCAVQIGSRFCNPAVIQLEQIPVQIKFRSFMKGMNLL